MNPDDDKKEEDKVEEKQFTPPNEPKSAPFTPPKGSGFTSPVISGKKSRKGLWIALVLLVFLIGGGLFAYLWLSEKDRADQLNQQVDSLASQTQPSGSQQTEPAEVSASYQATVGKFTLTLDDNYYIIVEHDGGFEGGPITQLRIGTKGENGTQTVDSSSHESVSITAVPLNGENFEDRVANALSADEGVTQTKLESVEVDGVDAEVYRLAGLFNDKKLFFTNSDVFYTITAGNAANDQSASEAVLTDVLAGFKFDA
jgi:hypothetical protein